MGPTGLVDHPQADPDPQENLNLPIDLGWVTKDKVCAGAEADVAACQ